MAVETKQARATDRALVSEEPWEVETIHKHFPSRSHPEVARALEDAKKPLKGSESREKVMEILKKKLS
jgi:hypothetical protein